MSERTSQADFDAMYAGTPPWDIGHPQPCLQAIAQAGGLKGRVLDAGCGTGEHALMAAGLGFETIGIDASPTAIGLARRKAEQRGLEVPLLVADALDLPVLGKVFDTVIDSGLFHVFDDADRARYVESLRAVTAPGARAYILTFSDRMPGDFGPRRVTEGEFAASFAMGWKVVSVEAAGMEVNFSLDPIPAWLATIERG